MARARLKRALPVAVVGLTLIAAACGSSAKTGAGAGTTAAGATTTAGGGSTVAGATTVAGAATGCAAADTSIDATDGKGAGDAVAALTCAQTKPLKAVGDPITVGFQNHEGDPSGSFPEYGDTAKATVAYINNELGGLGADVVAGKPGRPIKLVTCTMAVNPADSQRCANELSSQKPFTVVSALNFFGNQFPIYKSANIPVLVGSPITVGDFTSVGAFAIGNGGGCLGVHTGLVKFAAVGLKAKRIAVPWADTPPGVVCYYDLEKKPLDVLQGSVKGSSPLAGSIPDLQQIGVPIKPATADMTPQVSQVLAFKPDAIVFSAQGADCFNLISTLGRLGWTPSKIPLVMANPCVDIDKLKAAGDLVKGVYYQGSAGGNVLDPASNPTARLKLEAQTYLDKTKQYGASDANIHKGYGIQGFYTMMTIWDQMSQMAKAGTELTQANFANWMAKTHDVHAFFAVPFGCADAPTPYLAVCSKKVAIRQWDGTTFKTVESIWDGTDLIAGTELKPGP